MQKINIALLSLATLFSLAVNSLTVKAATDEQSFGQAWFTPAPPDATVSQIIYYRQASTDDSAEAALVYVDGELQSALMPGMFTRFCLIPGSHSLAAWQPDVAGITSTEGITFRAQLQPGKTYYLRVASLSKGDPQPVRRTEALKELAMTRQQAYALSRASAVVACQPIPASGVQTH